MSKVCHKCDWYTSVPAQKTDGSNKVYDHWDCAMKLAVAVGRDAAISMSGVQAATESFRNEMVKQNSTLGGQLYQALQKRNAPEPDACIMPPREDS